MWVLDEVWTDIVHEIKICVARSDERAAQKHLDDIFSYRITRVSGMGWRGNRENAFARHVGTGDIRTMEMFPSGAGLITTSDPKTRATLADKATAEIVAKIRLVDSKVHIAADAGAAP
jgi:hypothetical protein